jgi:hypothetical protein
MQCDLMINLVLFALPVPLSWLRWRDGLRFYPIIVSLVAMATSSCTAQ